MNTNKLAIEYHGRFLNALREIVAEWEIENEKALAASDNRWGLTPSLGTEWAIKALRRYDAEFEKVQP